MRSVHRSEMHVEADGVCGRVLALAYRDAEVPTEGSADKVFSEALERDLTLIALMGIQDPLRPEVVSAIQQCDRAGITVRMLTGGSCFPPLLLAPNPLLFVSLP